MCVTESDKVRYFEEQWEPNIGAQMTSNVWTKKKTFLKMPSIMFQKKVSYAGLERCDDRNFIFVQTITLMCL